MHPTAIATLVGFFGDAILQFMVRMGMGGSTGWGLKPYFKQHGSTEALFTAAGMMALFFVLYVATGLPLKLQLSKSQLLLECRLGRYSDDDPAAHYEGDEQGFEDRINNLLT
jgi:hypothetical protein